MTWVNPFDAVSLGSGGTPIVTSSPVVIEVPAGGTAPTKPAVMSVDNITAIDYGGSFCDLRMSLAWEAGGAGAQPGIGIYLFRLPVGAPPMDLAYHKPVTNTAVTLQGMIEVARMIPGSFGYAVRSDGAHGFVAAYAYDATRFFLAAQLSIGQNINGYNKIRSDWLQLQNSYASQSYQVVFPYKKG